MRLDTDEGVSGWCEACPWGSTYLPAFPKGIRAGLEELAPGLLGRDPRRTDVVNTMMDTALTGHPYVKSANEDLVRAHHDQACEGIGLKPNRVGGLTKARRIRDFCVQTGLRLNIEDTGGTALADTPRFTSPKPHPPATGAGPGSAMR